MQIAMQWLELSPHRNMSCHVKSCLGCSARHLHVLPVSVWMLHLPPKVQRQACQANRLS